MAGPPPIPSSPPAPFRPAPHPGSAVTIRGRRRLRGRRLGRGARHRHRGTIAGLVFGAPSLVIAIGDLVIANQPPGAKDLFVEPVRRGRQARPQRPHRRRALCSSRARSGVAGRRRWAVPVPASRSPAWWASLAAAPAAPDRPGHGRRDRLVAIGVALLALRIMLAPRRPPGPAVTRADCRRCPRPCRVDAGLGPSPLPAGRWRRGRRVGRRPASWDATCSSPDLRARRGGALRRRPPASPDLPAGAVPRRRGHHAHRRAQRATSTASTRRSSCRAWTPPPGPHGQGHGRPRDRRSPTMSSRPCRSSTST